MRQKPRRTVIVTGMHRSGTSMVASMVQRAGVDLGSGFPAPDDRNPHGYFEDHTIMTWQRRLLAAAVPNEPVGHPDWGWVESESLDWEYIDGNWSEARRLARGRANRNRRGLWGWKDPRTTVLLDFWDDQLRAARYILVFRDPAGVAGSIVRLGPGDLSETPDRPYRIWAFYNRRVLDFAQRHHDRCQLVEATAVADRPGHFAELLERFLGRRVEDLAPLVDRDLLQPGDPDATVPEHCRRLYADLCELSDLP